MITIKITEETETKSQMANALRLIADQLDNDMIGGYDPTWEIQGKEETYLIETQIEL